MKKIISLFMCVVLCATVFAGMEPMVSASATAVVGGNSLYEAKPLAYSTEYGVVLNSGDTRWFKFTTINSDDYWYNIKVDNVSVGNNNGHSGVTGTIYDTFYDVFAFADSFDSIGIDGGKLEPNKTYYLAIWGCRGGTIKFQLDYVFDEHAETKTNSTPLKFNTSCISKIDSPAYISEDRKGDGLDGDVDCFNFTTSTVSKVKVFLKNSDISYYNSYFEGVVAIISDDFGEQFGYIEVRPNKEAFVELDLKKNEKYYIKVFSSSGGIGKYTLRISDVCNHKYTSRVTKKATTKANGAITKTCQYCGKQTTSAIKKIQSVKLSVTKCDYNGKTRKPSVVVKNSAGTKLKKNTHYTVTYYGNRKNPGRYKVVVKFKGKYSGTKTLYFVIAPKEPGSLKINVGKTSIKGTWSKSKGAGGYYVEVRLSEGQFGSGKLVKRVYTKNKTCTVKGLKKDRLYEYRVGSYKSINGKKYRSGYVRYGIVRTKK